MKGIPSFVADCVRLAWFMVGPKVSPLQAIDPPQSLDGEIPWGVPEELWDICARMRDEVLLPAIKSKRLGRLGYLEITKAMPYYKYRPRHEILSLIDQGDSALRSVFRRTEYYRDQASRGGKLIATLKVYRYRKLFHHIRSKGLVFNMDRLTGLPFFFCARDIFFRLDGTHRTSVARYLGYRKVPALYVTPREVLSLAGVVDDLRGLLKSLEEPEPGAFEPVNSILTDRDIRQVLLQNREWYQDIEFGPFMKTYTHHGYRLGRLRHLLKYLKKDYKNRAVMAALPDLTGRRVLDIGCNAGLYSCYASMRGADYVLGIDMDQQRLDQARQVLDIFRGQGRVTGRVEFRRANIKQNLDLLDGFNTVMACCVLYHLGPVGELKQRLRGSKVDLLIIQCNVVRAKQIGKKNRAGVKGYEPERKTWGNILGTVKGAREFMEDCGFRVEKVTFRERQYPVLVGRRDLA
jgi:SAM-dependent methyltransferase